MFGSCDHWDRPSQSVSLLITAVLCDETRFVFNIDSDVRFIESFDEVFEDNSSTKIIKLKFPNHELQNCILFHGILSINSGSRGKNM